MTATALIGGLLKADTISFWACPVGHMGVTLLYNLAVFLVLDLVKVLSNRLLDRWPLTADSQSAKRAKHHWFSANRATLASESASRPPSQTPSRRTSRLTYQSLGGELGGGLGGGDRWAGKAPLRNERSPQGSASSSGSSEAHKSEVERLHGAVARLAEIVGTVAGEKPEVKAAISEILASVKKDL